jgi:di/tricarboxylate transporter
MSWQAWATLAVVLLTLALLARETFSPANTLLGAVIALLFARILTPAEAFSGFANSAPITVAALYVLARGVEATGLMQPVMTRLLGPGRGVLVRLTAPSAAASAFLNNTPLVAMLIPSVSDWAQRTGRSPSRYLMPLSYAVILGGVITLIGTSTNLVVSGLLDARTGTPMGLFEITPVGLPVAIVGLLVMWATARWLLPDRVPARQDLEGETAREFTFQMRVEPRGPLVGKTVEEARLRSLQGVYLIEVERPGEVIAPVPAETQLRADDRLCFVGRVDQVLDVSAIRGLVSAEQTHLAPFDSARHQFFEAVVGVSSPLVGKTLKETGFRDRYQAAVVAIHRAGQRINAKLGAVPLRVGDTLLLLGDSGFRGRWRDRGDFLLIAPVGGTPPSVTKKAWLVAAIVLAVVVVAGTGVLPMLEASLGAVIALVAFGVLTGGEARRAVDLEVILMIGASFGLGVAMEKSGLADVLAGGLTSAFGAWGPLGALLGIILATSLVTELITNNAAAALMFPIAFSTAEGIGADPRFFGIVVAVMASTSFLTPIGYQTNTMIYGPGGYRFIDYTRFGALITAAVMITILLVARYGYRLGV